MSLRGEPTTLLGNPWPWVLGRLLLGALTLAALILGLWHLVQVAEDTAQAVRPRYENLIAGHEETSAFVVRCWMEPRCSQDWNRTFSPLAIGVLPIFGGVPAGLAGVLLLALLEGRQPRKLAGTSRWAVAADVRQFLNPALPGYYGLFRLGWRTWRTLALPVRLRNANTLVVGAPGTGKTLGYFLPNILKDAIQGHSAIVYDYKYPAQDGGLALAPGFFKLFRRPVLAFRPFDMDSMRIDLLRGGEHFLRASIIAGMVIPRDKVVTDGSIYRDLARTLLKGLIMAAVREGHASLGYLARLTGAGPVDTRLFVEARPWLKTVVGSVVGGEVKMWSGAVNTVAEDLELFLHPALDRATSLGEPGEMIELADVFWRPSLLYLGIPQEEIRRGDGRILLNLIKRVVDAARQEAREANGGSQVLVHTSVYLDEWPNFGELDGIMQDLATCRSQNIAHHIGLQNLSQGYEVYGRFLFDAIKDTNFSSIALFGTGMKFEEAERWSGLLGEATFVESSRTRKRESPLDLIASHSHTQKEAKRRLLDPEELRRIKRGEAVVVVDGLPPARVGMPWVFQRQNPLSGAYRAALKLGFRFRRKPATPEDEARMLEPISRGERRADPSAMDEEEALRGLVAWLEEALKSTFAVRSYRRGGLLTRVDLFAPVDLDLRVRWERLGWAVAIPEGVGLKLRALTLLPPPLLKRLQEVA